MKTTDTKLPFSYTAHEFAEKLPLMEGKSRAITLASIKEDGVSKPVVLCKGKVLDGRNRLILAAEAGLKKEDIKFREFGSEPGDGDDALKFVFRENVSRRNLTEGHLGLVAAAIVKDIAARIKASPPKVSEEAQGNKGTGDGTTIPATPQKRVSHAAREEAAVVTGVSVDNVKKSQLVAQYPELAEKVEEKALSLNAAYEEAKRLRDDEKSTKDMQKRKTERADCLVAIAKDLGEDSSLLAAIKRGSILQGPDNHKNLLMFTELPKAEKLKLAPLLIQKLSVKDALRISSTAPDFDSNVLACINYAIVNGAGTKKPDYEFKVGKGDMSWTITLTPSKEAIAKLKA